MLRALLPEALEREKKFRFEPVFFRFLKKKKKKTHCALFSLSLSLSGSSFAFSLFFLPPDVATFAVTVARDAARTISEQSVARSVASFAASGPPGEGQGRSGREDLGEVRRGDVASQVEREEAAQDSKSFSTSFLFTSKEKPTSNGAAAAAAATARCLWKRRRRLPPALSCEIPLCAVVRRGSSSRCEQASRRRGAVGERRRMRESIGNRC